MEYCVGSGIRRKSGAATAFRATVVGFCVLLSVWLLSSQLKGENSNTARDNPFDLIHTGQLPANGRSCAECHTSPTTGGSSRRTVTRAGCVVGRKYIGVEDGGILHTINHRSSALPATMFGPRVTVNLLGDGYIEAISAEEFEKIAREEVVVTRGMVHGEVVRLSRSGKEDSSKAVGRFGWKAQHASLLDASADALLHELGVPNRVFAGMAAGLVKSEKAENDPERDSPEELDGLVKFIRNTKPIVPDPTRSKAAEAMEGSRIFDQIGCSLCHVRTLKTAAPGTHIPASNIVVDTRLGNKEVHPFSDYLLHDVGTGDGIVQNVRPEDYAASTANKFRTAPLWGVRFRLWLMHDGKSVTYHQAIMRHRGEALAVTMGYSHLSSKEQNELLEFLDSL